MKKHRIAAAVAAAVAVPAVAQVSVSGTVDVSYGSGRLNDSDDNMTSGKTDAFATSHIKFSGAEDLGGGLKGVFTIVQEFNSTTGARTDDTAGTTSGVDAGSFQETSVSLQGGFGEVKIGHFTMASRDAAGVGRFGGNMGRLSSTWRTNGDKVDNAIQYTTPSFSGVTVALAQSNDGTKSAATNDPKDTGALVRFTQGPLGVAVSQTTRNSGAATKNKETQIGIQYDLGVAKIGFVHAKDKDSDTETANVAQVMVPLGNGINVYGSAHRYKTEDSTKEATASSLAVTKDLSKRTAVYVAYNTIKNEGTATYKFGLIGKGVADTTSSATVVGVRHNF
jgi:predicted porin